MTQLQENRAASILPDEALLSLAENTMYAEGDPLCWGCEDGRIVGGFWELAAEVAKATASEAAVLRRGQARALFAMRAFYLLGVLRGGEAYRNLLTDADTEPEFKELPFTLDKLAAADFADDLNSPHQECFKQLLTLLGLSVPWADGKEEECV